MNTPPPWHLIQTFISFSRLGGLSETAQALKTTQPTITRQLIQFQSHFPLPLFEFHGRKKRLTPYATRLAFELQLILQNSRLPIRFQKWWWRVDLKF
jgi:DNA-binding transcriptional LysR family regulator